MNDEFESGKQSTGGPEPEASAPRAETRATRPAIRGFGYVYQRGQVWWVRYSYRGRDFRESSHSTRLVDAERLLKRRWKQIGRGRFVGPSEDRVTMGQLFDTLVVDYQNNQRRSLATLLNSRLAPLRAAFCLDRAVDVTEERIERYKRDRLASKSRRGKLFAVATLNRELAAMKRAFRLAVEQKRLSAAPTIKLLAEHNARQGFVDPAEFETIVGHLPEYLKDFTRFAYLSGWRRGELRTLTWADVDRDAGRITLRREHSKNEEPRVLVLVGQLGAIVERRWQARLVVRSSGDTEMSPLVFHRGGRPIGDFRKSWEDACTKAGLAGLLFHDLRRSCIRNMEKAGVSQSVAMKISGHRTATVYRRYRIVDETDIGEALARTQALVSRPASRTVVPIRAVEQG